MMFDDVGPWQSYCCVLSSEFILTKKQIRVEKNLLKSLSVLLVKGEVLFISSLSKDVTYIFKSLRYQGLPT